MQGGREQGRERGREEGGKEGGRKGGGRKRERGAERERKEIQGVCVRKRELINGAQLPQLTLQARDYKLELY